MITALQLSAFCVISRGKSWPRSAPMPMSSRGKSKTINIQRALINEEQRANDCDYEIPESATAAPGPDGSYVVGEINGDYEQLPA